MQLHCLWFFTLGRIREQEVVFLISCWYDDAIAAFKYKRLLLYNKINRKCTGRTMCNLWRKRLSIFISACWHRYQLKLWSGSPTRWRDWAAAMLNFRTLSSLFSKKWRRAVRWWWVWITYQFPGLWRFVQFVIFEKSTNASQWCS